MAGLDSTPNSQVLTIHMNSTNITFSLLEKIQRANSDFSLFEGCEKILIGLSGGADSVCLTTVLNDLREKYGFKLYACHINHMIRAQEADRDEQFSRDLCEKLGIEFISRRIDIPRIAGEKSESIETVARNERYGAFREICLEKGIFHIATAHNKNDNAETVLFNLIRGSGTRGLCGIPPKRTESRGLFIIRPMIYVSRDEIEAFLEERGQGFITDSTNLDTDYTRNCIRARILPEIRKINPSFDTSLQRSCGILRDENEYLDRVAKDSFSDKLGDLCLLDKCILSRIIIMHYSEKSSYMPEQTHINALCRKIYEYKDNKSLCCRVSFPDGLCASIYAGRLSFIPDERKKKKERFYFEKNFAEGEMFFENSPYALYISFDQKEDIPKTLSNNENIYKKVITDYLYSATIPDSLMVRNRKDGDKILHGGIHKSLKRPLSTAGIPEKDRFTLPIICKGNLPILIPSVICSDSFKNDNTKPFCFSVTLYRLD